MRAAIQTAMDALEDGDTIGAYSVLESALADEPHARHSIACPSPLCGSTFEWPGELDTHWRFAHAGYEGEE
jgi:hypothetical protein